jgi:putative CocE/NonD family hydrolase
MQYFKNSYDHLTPKQMKPTSLLLILVFFAIQSSAQKLYFANSNYSDSSQFEKNIPVLAKQVIDQYQENDPLTYNNNLYKLQLVAGDHLGVSATIKKLCVFDHGDSIAPSGLASIYKIYSSVLAANPQKEKFTDTYNSIFQDFYQSLTEDGKNWLSEYFDNNPAAYTKSLQKKKNEFSKKDSLTIAEAIQLCKAFCDYKTYTVTSTIGIQNLKKLDNEKYIINDSILVKMPDGGQVALTVVINKKISGKQPAVLMYTIYAGTGVSRCKEAASRGYIGIEANTRGKRLSPDKLEPHEFDAKDAYYIIDWISKQPWSNGKVGMYGGSYLGFSQWSSVKYLHPALKTIVPQVAVAAGVDYPLHNNIFMTFMLRWIHFVQNNKLTDNEEYANEEKWNKTFGDWYKSGASYRKLDSIEGRKNATFQKWLNHPSYDSYWKNMTPQQSEFSKINIPIFTTTGYRDDDQVGAMYYFQQYHQWNKNPNYYLLIGPWDHGGSQGYPKPELGGYKIDSIAKLPILDIVFQWFDYILKDSSKPAMLKDKINFEIMGKNEWKHVPSIDKMHNDSLRLYFSNLGSNNKYPLLAKKPSQLAFISQTVDFKDRSELLFAGDNMGSYPLLLDTTIKAEKEKMIFISDPIDQPYAISGAVTATIVASVNKKDMDLVFDLFELTPDGKYFALEQNLQRASYAKDRSKRQLLQPNKIETINMDHTYITCRQLQKGSRIVILIGVNKNPSWQINYGTGKDVSDETIKDAAIPFQIKWYNSSYINIPILR